MSFGDLYRKAAEDVKNRFEYHYTTFEYECNIASLKDHEREIASDATLDMRGLERMARKYTKYMPEHSSDMNDKEHFKMVFDAFKDFCEQEHVAEPYKLMASMLSKDWKKMKADDLAGLQGYNTTSIQTDMKKLLKPNIEVDQPHAHMSMGM